jgi:hypothetical protein
VRPGAGFVIVGAALLVCGSFFAWGAATPLLDDVWRLQIELDLGERPPLERSELRTLERALARYPGLAAALLGGAGTGAISANEQGVVTNGYLYLVRTGAAQGLLEVEIADGEVAPLGVTVRAGDSGAAGEVAPDQRFAWRLPDGPFPQVVEVKLDEEPDSQRRVPRAVRVHLAEAL